MHCPVGSLCAELGKEEGPLADKAGLTFRQLLAWIEAQFAAVGRKRDKKALAIHLLAALQGVSLLANCFHDPDLVTLEGKHMTPGSTRSEEAKASRVHLRNDRG